MNSTMLESMADEVDALSAPDLNYHSHEAKPFSPRQSLSEDMSEDPSITENGSDGFSFSFSEDDLIPFDTYGPNSNFNEFSNANYIQRYEDSDLLYTKAVDEPVEARITVQRTFWIADSPPDSNQTSPTKETASISERKGRRTSRSFSRLNLRSRSGKRTADSSAKNQPEEPNPRHSDEVVTRNSRRQSLSSKKDKPLPARPTHQDEQENVPTASKGLFARRSGKFSKKPQPAAHDPAHSTTTPKQPQHSPGPSSSHATPPVSAMRPLQPTSTLQSNLSPSLSRKDLRSNFIAPISGSVLNRVQRKTPSPVRKKKDELWNNFRSLESDYNKLHDKTVPLKATSIRTTLIPFLQTYATHPSNYDIEPEDLDRRVKILDKWWKALLDILDGQGGTNVSGFDRISVMEAASALMERPEWRPVASNRSSPPQSLDSRTSTSSTPAPPSQHSEEQGPSLEAIHTNIRHTFMHNLFRQMSIVVDKMATRSVASSLVTFCGKSCAYAFFFCTGMADVLVRLWQIPARNIKRAADSMGISNPSTLAQVSPRILAAFPECMHCLDFSSYRSAVFKFRKKPVLPLGFEKIPWTGPWLERWCGNESDLFYVFIKFFHCLMADFLPENPTPEEMSCVPGYVLIRAQLLANLESTIHRFDKAGVDIQMDGMLDDMLNADGPGVPPLPSNASRTIAENRVIMLMRNFLCQTTSTSNLKAQTIFANCVCDLMKTAACGTSLFDQGSCFTMCDLLQEMLVILGKFENRTQVVTNLDWNFWLLCFAQMVQSDSTLTLIRIVALLFSTWPHIVSDESRKADLCFKFILQENVFALYFLHWCPMIRSYFMRLLAWRLARFDGDCTTVDSEIYKLLLGRILEIWAFFKFAVDAAEEYGTLMPSTAPCNPAPGRRLLIIRTDNILPANLGAADSSSESNSPTDTPKNDQVTTKSGTANGGGGGFSPGILFDKLSATLEQGIDSGKRKSGLFRSFTNPRLTDQKPTAEGWSEFPPVEASLARTVSAPTSAISSSRSSLYETRPWIPSESKSRLKSNNIDKVNSSDAASQIPRQAEFRFSIEPGDRRPNKLPREMSLGPPKLPHAAYTYLQSLPDFVADVHPLKPDSVVTINGLRYSGRALAEWSLVVNECQNFFERRRKEGVPTSKQVETPIMSSEPFRRFG